MDSDDILPKQFLSSLRILFDILDENRTGLIRLQDIESRWSDDGVRGLPAGVVDGLRKVTPPNGLLSFDRFVSGLKLVLVRRKDNIETEGRKPLSSKENYFFPQHRNQKGSLQYSDGNAIHNRANFQSLGTKTTSTRHDELDGNQQKQQDRSEAMKRYDFQHQKHNPKGQHSPIQREPTYSWNSNKEILQHQSDSTSLKSNHGHHNPQLQGIRNSAAFQRSLGNIGPGQNPLIDGPPSLPPRSGRPPGMSLQQSKMRKSQSGPDLSSHLHSPPAVPPRQASSHIIADLKNWQSSQEKEERGKRLGRSSPTNWSPVRDSGIYANLEDFRSKVSLQQSQQLGQQHQSQPQQPASAQAGPLRATVRRHGSGRRHTLSNGIDHNMLRRMKQLEEEAAILQSGLAMLDCAKDWYKKQLATVSDRQAMLGKVSYNDNSMEAYQERMNFQRARISEVNQHLKTLIESSEKGFPLHMNLAISNKGNSLATQDITATQRQIESLREQNRQLQHEASHRREHVSQLEREKSSLVRELFEARAKNKPAHDDTTFM